MGSPQFSEWKAVGSGGEIAAELLPAGFLQYRYSLDYIWTPDDFWFGMDGGLFSFTGHVAVGELVSEDVVKFLCFVMGIAGLVDLWTYYPGTMTTTGPANCPTFGGDQLDWQYDPAFGSAGFGIDQLYIVGCLVSPIYEIDLDEGAAFTTKTLRPQYAIEGSWALEVRTAPGAAGANEMVKDNATGDKYLMRLHDKVLFCKRWLGAYQSPDGPTIGMQVEAAGGLSVVVRAGQAYFGLVPAVLAADATLTLPASATSHVWARWTGTETEVLATQAEIPSGDAYLLAIVKAGTSVTPGDIDQTARGSVVVIGGDDYSAVGHEDGRLECAVDMGSERDVMYESRDRGLTWERRT
jgi:hypothetical protein